MCREERGRTGRRKALWPLRCQPSSARPCVASLALNIRPRKCTSRYVPETRILILNIRFKALVRAFAGATGPS